MGRGINTPKDKNERDFPSCETLSLTSVSAKCVKGLLMIKLPN